MKNKIKLLIGDHSHNHFDHFILTISKSVSNCKFSEREREVNKTKANVEAHHLKTILHTI